MTETLKIPKEAVNSNWRDDIDEGYVTYDNEKEYISPTEVSKESINMIKKRKLGSVALFTLKDKLTA